MLKSIVVAVESSIFFGDGDGDRVKDGSEINIVVPGCIIVGVRRHEGCWFVLFLKFNSKMIWYQNKNKDKIDYLILFTFFVNCNFVIFFITKLRQIFVYSFLFLDHDF